MKNRKKFLTFLIAIFAIATYAQNDSIFHFQLQDKDYEIIKVKKNYSEACMFAVDRGGHLVHINDSIESAGVYDAIINGAGVPVDYTVCYDAGNIAYVWIGATDAAVEGEWLWDGDCDSSGVMFFTGEGDLGAGDGTLVDGAFANWGGISVGSFNEPDNYANQDAAAIALDGWPNGSGNFGIAGEWNDIKTSNSLYFVIEYEGNYGIEEKAYENEINLYPNPAKDYCKIEGDKISYYELFDITGHLISKEFVYENTITIPAISKGIYFLKLYNDKSVVYCKKLIKE